MVSALVLDAHEKDGPVVSQTKKIIEQSLQTIWFRLNHLNILPCASCSACGHRTPGICSIKDDMESVMRAIAQTEIMIMFTPVWFGGYPSTLKKAVDRFMPMGLPLYRVEKGHLLHPMRYPKKCLIGIGIMAEPDIAQEENFKALIAQNGLNFQLKTLQLVVYLSEDKNAVHEKIAAIIEEAIAL